MLILCVKLVFYMLIIECSILKVYNFTDFLNLVFQNDDYMYAREENGSYFT